MSDSLSKATPYMLRNDGKLLDCYTIHPYVKYVYDSVDKTLEKLSDYRFVSLVWFYENTSKEDTKNLIKSIISYLFTEKLIDENKYEIFNIDQDTYTPKKDEIEWFVKELNDNTNQEFLRVRTSSLLFGGKSNDIYFRISSIGFNWFNLIWKIVYRNRDFISTVTICKDSNTFGNSFDPYTMSGKKLDHIDVNEFINLSGKPVIEVFRSKYEVINEAINKLRDGKVISESFDKQLHPAHIHNWYEELVNESLDYDISCILSRGRVGYET